MSGLTEFLLSHPVRGLEEEVILSHRLADHPFRIVSMRGEEVERYLQVSRKEGKKAGFDSQSFQMQVILNHTLEPDFRDVRLLDQAGCRRPEDFVDQFLLAGEIAALVRQIAKLSGYDQDFGALRNEVKN